LDLSSNFINGLNPKDAKNLNALTNLEILDLNRNEIRFMIYGTFKQMSRLEYLDISYNSLRVLDVDSLNGAVNLKYLFLHNNPALLKITNFEFSTLPRLEYFALQQCSIKSMKLPRDYEDGESLTKALKKIWLFGNPLTCDCYILPLIRFLKFNKVQLDPVKHNNLSNIKNFRMKGMLNGWKNAA